MRRHHTLPIRQIAVVVLLLLTAFAGSLPAVAGELTLEPEELHYRWNLGRFLGRIAGIFLPSEGDGVMTLERNGGGYVAELLITSEHSRKDEFWRYGSRIDPADGHAVEAWSSYRWRGETDSERESLTKQDVMDIVSGIYAIRREPPTSSRRMEIWSDGKIYPVEVTSRGQEARTIAGRSVATRHYTVSGYKTPDGRLWKGSLELWLATDAAATPVEIHITRNLAALQLRLQSW